MVDDGRNRTMNLAKVGLAMYYFKRILYKIFQALAYVWLLKLKVFALLAPFQPKIGSF